MDVFNLVVAILWSIALVIDISRWAMDRKQTKWWSAGPHWRDVFLPEGCLVFLLWLNFLNSLG